MSTAPYPSLLAALRALVGTEMSVVTFVEGYVQIEFDGRRMSVLTNMDVLRGGVQFASNEPQFRHALEACVASVVIDVQENGDTLSIQLSGDATLKICLASPSNGSEAFIYNDVDGRSWVT